MPGEGISPAYSSRILLPYFESSMLFGEVNEIVWNMPVVSESEAVPDKWSLPNIAKIPYHDDIRVIITQNKNGFSIKSTLIPPLTDWSKRFSANGIGNVRSMSFILNTPL